MASMQSKMIKITLKKLVQTSLTPHLNVEKLRWDDFQKPSPSSRKYCHSEEVLIHGVSCYWMTPKIKQSDKIILYFHGGAYVCGPSLLHWRMLAQISQNMSNVSIGDDPMTVTALAPAFAANITSSRAPSVIFKSARTIPLHILLIRRTPAIPSRLINGVPASIIIRGSYRI